MNNTEALLFVLVIIGILHLCSMHILFQVLDMMRQTLNVINIKQKNETKEEV